MGLYDWYRPKAPLACPSCGQPLTEWQGKEAACALLVWEEGSAAPIDQRVDEDVRLEAWELHRFRLPAAFAIYSFDCPAHQPLVADCSCADGVWTVTRLQPPAQPKRP